ncbi:MAG TPA: hypothetical protein VGV18_06760, partial [Verrucomicrobiae bacterium]|nr:hypothetical protein [Verrucomicrobiae bacterium]
YVHTRNRRGIIPATARKASRSQDGNSKSGVSAIALQDASDFGKPFLHPREALFICHCEAECLP